MTIRSRKTFEELVTLPDLAIPLAEAALLVACEEYPRLSIAPYLRFLDQAAERTESKVSGPPNPETTIAALNEVLFDEYGFQGNTTDYYDARNSFLNAVIERRTGIPIALSTIYIAVAARLDFAIEGVGVPGHFVVRHRQGPEEVFLDPFSRGAQLDIGDLMSLAAEAGASTGDATWLKRATNRQILIRMLNNLRLIYLRGQAYDKALSMMDLMLITEPTTADLYRARGMLRLKLRQFEGAARDLRAYIRRQPEVDSTEVKKTSEQLAKIKAILN